MKRLIKKLKLIFARQPRLQQPVVMRSTVLRCEKCNSKKVGRTWYYAYTRGWNDLCNQAVGDTGAYCNDCGHITFVRSLEDFKKSLPNWCRAFSQ